MTWPVGSPPGARVGLVPTMRERAAATWRALKGDGCSRVPDWHEEWAGCCHMHDADYRTGNDERGVRLTRARSDRRLRECMTCCARTFVGRWLVAPVYYLGVQVFGRAVWAAYRRGERNHHRRADD